MRFPSPIRVASPSKPHSSPRTPSSPIRVPSPIREASPPKHIPVRVARPTDPYSSTHHESSPLNDEINLRILNQAIYKLLTKDKFMKKNVAEVEATNRILKEQIVNLEQSVFDLKEEIFYLKEQIKKKDGFILQFFQDQFPDYFKTYKKEMATGSFSSATISEKDATLSEDEVDPSLLTGIAKRVQKRNDRKRKVISTHFTMGDRKKKILKNLASKEKLGDSISSDTPAIAPELALAPTPAAAPPSPTAPAPTSPSELALAPETAPTAAPPRTPAPPPTTEPEPKNAPVTDKAMIVYEVDDSKEIELRPASEILDYPGRSLISEDKILFINNGLK
ncbi:uncharacterized protein LOC110103943 [Dendrobium catenatum]|uniref:uncharacterized protein LOC110103943 n=1 Tax=Dendrobium catenatum TaxID=906689 RepID=UPI0009F265D3|nr:uncharacterized protein LOC110103943 [Dendrobium catenatum]